MKKDAVVALIAVVAVLVAAYVLAAVRPDAPLTPSKPFTAAASHATKKKVAPNDKVIMHINGEPITEAEFNTFAQSAPAETRAFYGTTEGKRMLADELVKLKALEQEGRRLGVDNDPAVQNQLNSISAQVIAGKALERLVKDGSDKRIADEFAKAKGTAKTLRHILVAYQGSAVPPKSGQPLSADKAMERARAIVAKIRAGMNFEQVARTDSDDAQTAESGGLLGTANPEQLPPNIAAVVKTLTPGAVSDPLRTEFGIHIFRVDEPSIEDMRPMLTERVSREVAAEAVSRLQKAAKVELDPKFFPPVAPVPPQQQQGLPGTPKPNS